MSEAKQPGKGAGVLKGLREIRDVGMDAWAKVALRLTSSHGYHRLNGAVVKPALLATAMFRNASELVTSALLAQLNMPSRQDVLSLAQRMTRIEMVLDDLGAGMDQLRRTAVRPQRASSSRDREASGDRRPAAPMSAAAKEG